jgi:hypothetical protein
MTVPAFSGISGVRQKRVMTTWPGGTGGVVDGDRRQGRDDAGRRGDDAGQPVWPETSASQAL